MKPQESPCDRVQELVAELGAAALEREAGARHHVTGCAYCQRVIAALGQIDAALPELAREDAPAAAIARVRAAAAEESSREASKASTSRRRTGGPLWAGMAASVVVAVAAGTLLWPQYRDYQAGVPTLFSGGAELGDLARPLFESEPTGGYASAGAKPSVSQASAPEAGAASGVVGLAGSYDQDQSPRAQGAGTDKLTAKNAPGPDDDAAEERLVRERPPVAGDEALRDLEKSLALGRPFLGPVAGGNPGRADAKDTFADAQPPTTGLASETATERANEPEAFPEASEALAALDVRSNLAIPELRAGLEGERQTAAGPAVGAGSRGGERATEGKALRAPGPALPATASDADARALARRYLSERERLAGLATLPTSGYWANGYLPGDPRARLLELRLAAWDRSELPAQLAALSLERRARPGRQPFDAPSDAALAAYVHADRAAVAGPSRLRLQVGLRGAERRGGQRPAMNVGLVVDRRAPLAAAELVRVRALVAALAAVRQPGDRFSLTIAGPGGGLAVAPEAFRHGPLSVALEALATPPSGGAGMSLRGAIARAAQAVAATHDPAAPLGASVVLLLATAPLGAEAGAIESLVHAQAVSGIVTSAVAVSAGADDEAIERTVLLGQGRRAVLDGAGDAARLIDRELYAASRAVARAVRLRIELAPGVRLIEVLGSRRLDEPAAGRVREAERSIDRRLARNLGIAGDRGEDEAGVQIVIPHFYAGDAHVVLLDVAVDGPGPVAEVSVRYKDLVRLANGVARASFALEPGERAPGPLERNVLKNELALRLAERIRAASVLLEAGDPRGAADLLAGQRALIAGLRLEIAGWQGDEELADDLALLDEYLSVLRSPVVAGPAAPRVADSLRGAANRRLLTPAPRVEDAAER